MDELEFRKRVYATPNNIDQDILDAASTNPALQKILDETRQFDNAIVAAANDVPVPDGLAERLLALAKTAPATPTSTATTGSNGRAASKPSSNNFFQYYAMAASLLFAIGIGVVITVVGGPNPNEVAFGSELIQHMYHEVAEIDAIKDGSDQSAMTMPAVVRALAEADSHFTDDEFLRTMPVRFAKPCIVLPAYQSAHLMVQGVEGAVNIIIINNNPVSSEYTIHDDRFDGIVMPLGDGNLVLIGEKDENLDTYKSLFAQNVEWAI